MPDPDPPIDVSLEGLEFSNHETSARSMQREDAERVGRRVAIALMRGSEETALDVVRTAWEQHIASLVLPSGNAILDEPLSTFLGDDVRLLNAIEGAGIHTVGQFLAEEEGGLPAIANVGWVALARLTVLAVDLRARAARA